MRSLDDLTLRELDTYVSRKKNLDRALEKAASFLSEAAREQAALDSLLRQGTEMAPSTAEVKTSVLEAARKLM